VAGEGGGRKTILMIASVFMRFSFSIISSAAFLDLAPSSVNFSASKSSTST